MNPFGGSIRVPPRAGVQRKRASQQQVEFMNVSLLPEFEELIHQKVQSGQYGSSDEVVNAALRLLKERDPVSRRRVGLATPAVNEFSSRNFVRPRQFTEIT